MSVGTEPNVWRRLFSDHPASLNESYWQHSRVAARTGARLLGMGLACMCHAVIPGMCEETASRGISNLVAEIRNVEANCP